MKFLLPWRILITSEIFYFFWELLRVVLFCFDFINLFTLKCLNISSHKEKSLHCNLWITTIIYSMNIIPSLKTQTVESIIFFPCNLYYEGFSVCSFAAESPFLRLKMLKTKLAYFKKLLPMLLPMPTYTYLPIYLYLPTMLLPILLFHLMRWTASVYLNSWRWLIQFCEW